MNSHGGPDRSFEHFVRSSRNTLLVQAYRICRDWDEAEDLVQLTLWNLYRRWEQLTDRERLHGYAGRTLYNLYTSARRRRRWSEEVLVAAAPEQLPADAGIDAEDHIFLASVLRRLPRGQRRVVMLRYYEDLSINQIAQLLGCSPGNVTGQASRALRTLRALLTS